jgi:hypothetical protein
MNLLVVQKRLTQAQRHFLVLGRMRHFAVRTTVLDHVIADAVRSDDLLVVVR